MQLKESQSLIWHCCVIAVSVLSGRSRETSFRVSGDESASDRTCPTSSPYSSQSVRLPPYPHPVGDNVSRYRVQSSVSECYVQHGTLVAVWAVRGNFSEPFPRVYGTWGNERSASHFQVDEPRIETDGTRRYEVELPQVDARISYVMLNVYPCSTCNRSSLHCQPVLRLPWLPLRTTSSDLERLFVEQRYVLLAYVVLVQFLKHVALFTFGIQLACCVYLRYVRPRTRRHRRRHPAGRITAAAATVTVTPHEETEKNR
ncbi:membrane glycoprotein US9 [Panine betaherpesvirus 2]|uniref:Membrane glycoprotein US9 n=1 Tax=Panine betaherpesvirus 2 TaxID=188763 RepID=Q8QRV0_9BETA|nr:membrane glycoprotein US9 [Panine betaherpesvirus 2]AAM00788.1 membrane glycoprotein US9 [Panine betaherpesvirus 2]QXV67906.1 membrane glycoprotein US9 [Panine betaherpesvirus 2]